MDQSDGWWAMSADAMRFARCEEYARLTAGLPAPLAVVDLDAFDRNAGALVARAAGTPIRVASKSVRCRTLIARALARPGFAGVLAYSLQEALWLAAPSRDPHGAPDSGGAGHSIEGAVDGGVDDVVVAYPTVDRVALTRLVTDATARSRVSVMVDAPEHLALLESVHRSAHRSVHRSGGGAQDGGGRVGVWLDIDASLRVGPLHLGARRSPLHTPAQAAAAARAIASSDAVELRGVMFYDAQIAGMPDSGRAVRAMKRRSAAELLGRRREVLAAIRAILPVPVVNASGTGSLHVMGADPLVTELAAGSGLLGPTLFDGYRAFTPEPAAAYALDVVRHPAPGFVTAFSGGYVASGAAGPSRLPTPCWPPGLRLVGTEGAGEVQTPLAVSRGHATPPIGSRVWMRHAKAGELLERFDAVHLLGGTGNRDDHGDHGDHVDRGDHGGGIEGAEVADRPVVTVPSYRGEGRCFG